MNISAVFIVLWMLVNVYGQLSQPLEHIVEREKRELNKHGKLIEMVEGQRFNYSLKCHSNSTAVSYYTYLLKFTCLDCEYRIHENFSAGSFFITIQLASLTADDSGYYICVWSNDFMNEMRTSSEKVRFDVKRPTFAQIMDNSTKMINPDKTKDTNENENIILNCTFPLNSWTVNWMYADVMLPTKNEIDQYFNYFRYLLEDLYPTNDENYICLVTMRNQENHPKEINHGESATMDCPFIGEPKPTIELFKDGKNYQNYKIVVNTTSIFSRVQVEDEGEYFCRASQAGIQGQKIRVKVNRSIMAQFDLLKLSLLLTIAIAVSGFVFVCVLYLFQLQKSETLSEMYQTLIKFHSDLPMEKSSGFSFEHHFDDFSNENVYELNRDAIEIGRMLGRGNFGIVNEGWIKKQSITNKTQTCLRFPVAIKSPYDKSDKNQLRILAEELKVMGAIGKHPNVLALIGAITENRHGEFLLVVEMCELGNLRDYLIKNRETYLRAFGAQCSSHAVETHISWKNSQSFEDVNNTTSRTSDLISFSIQIANENNSEVHTSDLYLFSIQIASGMEYLAQIPCVHRDLAARNVLLTTNKIVKVADFGMARKHEDKTYYRINRTEDLQLPYKWMSPETIQEYKYTQKSDVWAFGITLYEIFSLGKTPCPLTHHHDLLDYLLVGNRNSKPQYCDDDVYELMKRCWQIDPLDRPNFAHCVYFFKEHIKKTFPQLLEQLEHDIVREEEKQESLDFWLREENPDPRILAQTGQSSCLSMSENYYAQDFFSNV